MNRESDKKKKKSKQNKYERKQYPNTKSGDRSAAPKIEEKNGDELSRERRQNGPN